MTKEEFEQLERGDIVWHIAADKAYVVDAHYGDSIIAVRTVLLTNPEEWQWIQRPKHGGEKK